MSTRKNTGIDWRMNPSGGSAASSRGRKGPILISLLAIHLWHSPYWRKELLGFSAGPGLYQQLRPKIPHEPVAVGLPDVPRRLYPRPHDLAVLGGPSPCARQRVILIVDHGFQAVDLLLGELQRVHERVGHGVILPQVSAHDGRAFGRS